jgi:hypothetical protein
MAKSKTYGELKVTDAEFARAKFLAWERSGVRGEQCYQLKNYCEGRMYIRDDAEQALAFIRGGAQ